MTTGKFFYILAIKKDNIMIVRPYYLNVLKTYRDVPLVKILAGIRRCGKSTILEMLKEGIRPRGCESP